MLLKGGRPILLREGRPILLRGGHISNREIPSPIVVRQEIYPILQRGGGRPMLRHRGARVSSRQIPSPIPLTVKLYLILLIRFQPIRSPRLTNFWYYMHGPIILLIRQDDDGLRDSCLLRGIPYIVAQGARKQQAANSFTRGIPLL